MSTKRSSARQAARGPASTAPAEAARKPKSTPKKAARTLRSKTQDISSVPASPPRRRKERNSTEESVDLADRPGQRGNKKAQQKSDHIPASSRSSSPAPRERQGTLGPETQDTIVAASNGANERQVAESFENSQEAGSLQDEPELAEIRSPALTGTTARNSYATRLLDDLEPQQMVDELPELWESSKRLIHLLAPFNAKPQDMSQLRLDLQAPTSLESRNKLKYSNQLHGALDRFTSQSFMNVSQVSLALFKEAGVQDMSQVVDASLRVEDVLFMANLAALTDTESLAVDGNASHETWEQLDREFPLPFLASFGDAVDQSALSLSKDTFELALSIRCQLFKSIVAQNSQREDFVAEDALQETYLHDVTKPVRKGWDLGAWSSANLSQEYNAMFDQQLEDLQFAIQEHNDSESDDLSAKLERSFPNEAFCSLFTAWVSQRGREIEEGFRSRVAEDIAGLQKKLDRMLKGSMSSSINLSAPRGARGGEPASPTTRKGRSSMTKGTHGVESSATGATGRNANQNTAENRQYMKRFSKQVSANLSAVEKTGAAGAESGQDAQPLSNMEAPTDSTHVQKVKSRRAVRESTVKQRFLDKQANARQVALIDEDRGSVDGDNDDYIPQSSYEQDEGQDNNEDEDDDEGEFQNDSRKKFSRLQRPAASKKRPSSAVDTSPSKRSRVSVVMPEREGSEQNTALPPPPTQTSRSKMATSSTGARIRTPRRPWTAAEDDAFIEGLNHFEGQHQRYSLIREALGQPGQPLERRNNMHMKDRARNLKLKWIKSGSSIPMPLGLQSVPLKASDVAALRAQGFKWEDATCVDFDE